MKPQILQLLNPYKCFRVLLAVLPLISAGSPLGASAEAPWRWINVADFHAAEVHAHIWETPFPGKGGGAGWRKWGYSSQVEFQTAMLDRDIETFSRLKEDYGGEVLVIPGDTNGGHWYLKPYRDGLRSVYPDLTDEEVIRKASHLCYGGLRNATAVAGFEHLIVAVGDHEIGDNPWRAGSDVARLVPEFRAGHADVFNEAPVVDPDEPDNPRLWNYGPNAFTANRLFDDPIGTVLSRPLGTTYEETSFAWQYKNVLFVTVDIFRQDGPDIPLGEEGTVVGEIEGRHMEWFKAVLAEAKTIPSIKHIIVQAHLPIIYPVRKYASSGMMVDRNDQSAFLQAMREGGVDLYLAGEVHSNTVTLDDQSELVQWVCRGNNTSNFSTVDVSDDKLLVRTWKNKGRKADDILLGTLSIDKSGTGPRTVETTGLLTAINPKGLNLHYTFDELVDADSILTGIAPPEVSGAKCQKAFVNTGEFTAEYTAWTKATETGPGVTGNAVRMVPGKSVLGLSSIGPVSHDHPRTISLWIKTDSDERQILFNTTSFWGKTAEFFNLSLNDGHLEIALRKGKVKSATSEKINDGKWHHVAAVVPSRGAILDDVRLYIDGSLAGETKSTGGSSVVNTAQANWMGIGVLLSKSGYKLDKEMGMKAFDGWIDDFALWTRALSPAEVAALHAGAVDGKNAFDMEQTF
ncbi:MAG: LamG-like jellyroll fold domain-containing protein [Puniceicoccaceae bacterium]